MKTKIVLCLIFILSFSAACGQSKKRSGNDNRAAFMTSLQLVIEANEIDEASREKGEMKDADLAKMIGKLEAAHALAVSIDDGFLKWVEPGLPAAFAKLTECLDLRAKGLRRNDVAMQAKSIELWQPWGEYWQSHDSDVYKKLKVE